MPHATETDYLHISVIPLSTTVGAEISGVDLSTPVSDDVFAEILKAITHYGVLVFRSTSLDDASHVTFSARFGELDDVKPYLTLGRKNRFAFDEIFDVSNLEDDGSIVEVDSKRDHMGRGNSLYHVDSSFNPRRASYSFLRAAHLPPSGYGGNTDFADTRTAYLTLPPHLKSLLESENYTAAHSLWHSRRKAVPSSPYTSSYDPEKYPFSRHKLLQIHEPSGRMNIYIANHVHHLEYHNGERVPEPRSTDLIEELLAHCTQPQHVLSVEWENVGDLVMWDNTCVMHRASPEPGPKGSFVGRFKRDMRRCTVHDGSSQAWGLNEKTSVRMGLP